MSRLGLGLLGRPQSLPPNPGNVVALFDPLVGVTSSGGLVDSWSARFGVGVVGAAGASRPTQGSDFLDFDGVDDALSGAALAVGGLSAATFAFWIRPASAAASVPVEQNAYPNGVLSFLNPGFADFYPGSEVARTTGPLAVGSWSFLAMRFDGSAGAGLKTRIFAGAAPGSVADVTAFSNTTLTTIPASSGSFVIGGRSTVFFGGQIGIVAAYNIPLNLPQIQALAAYRVPA